MPRHYPTFNWPTEVMQDKNISLSLLNGYDGLFAKYFNNSDNLTYTVWRNYIFIKNCFWMKFHDKKIKSVSALRQGKLFYILLLYSTRFLPVILFWIRQGRQSTAEEPPSRRSQRRMLRFVSSNLCNIRFDWVSESKPNIKFGLSEK